MRSALPISNHEAQRTNANICKAEIIVPELQPEIWETYRQHFESSENQSAFLSPSVVKASAVAIVFITVSQENPYLLLWMQPCLRAGKPKTFQFFGETETDFIHLIFAQGLSHSKKKQALVEGFRQLNPPEIRCRKFKTGSEYATLLLEAIQKLGYQTYSIPYISSPFASFDPASPELFKKIFSKSTIRNLHNRLQKQAYLEFEALELPGERASEWISDFCDLHEWRWSKTHTPSRFTRNEERNKFQHKTLAMLNDGKAALFAIKLNGQRQSLVLALKEEPRLIYHQIANTQDPELYYYSIYKILIKYIGEWMRERHFTTLDFGIGNESYKLEYATGTESVLDIFGSRNNLKTWFQEKYKRFYYDHAAVQRIFLSSRRFLAIGGQRVQYILSRSRQLISYIINDPKVYLRKAASIIKGKHTFFYILPSNDKRQLSYQPHGTYQTPAIEAILNFYNNELLMTPARRGKYIAMHRREEKSPRAILDEKNQIACLGWVAAATENDSLPYGALPENTMVLSDFITAKAARGKGLYPRLLQSIAAAYPEKNLTIYTADWNIASQRGIKKAGFERFFTQK